MSESNAGIEMIIKQSGQDVPDTAELQSQILEQTRHRPQSVPRQHLNSSNEVVGVRIRRWWSPLLATAAVAVLAVGVMGDQRGWYRDASSAHITSVNEAGEVYQLELQELLILEDDRLFAQL